MKKILVLGSTGLLGNAVVDTLKSRHEVVEASFNHPENAFDLSDPQSLIALFEKVGAVDAIICTAGVANLVDWHTAQSTDWTFAISNKMMGQINTLRFGEKFVNDGGVIIVTSGILAQHPFKGSSVVTTVNAAVEAAETAAAIEVERIRFNAISPGWVAETMVNMGMDPEPGIPASDIAQYYVNLLDNSVSGTTTVAAKH
ncbi:short chain dehydrogenase [Pseudoalteromonas sp. SMS1]|uniref:short chain dehydrogenase n=1 Tax=Pseudoalteromonas sp. SMS1 TaxID=2908894 RepID=UPI001F33CAE9|nr:short chain dehydrogenase [Pseudoalteromonas sp. SMS1]MCF2859194.1 short chain dehydrogenase [Pseudoalteromonas sp. SMS1]